MIGDGRRSNPYVGLRPFEADDSLYFFGRRAQVAELLLRLHETRFLAVVGTSGCGKSSLIRAGLIPSLLGGFLVQDRDRWLIATTKPDDGPLANLALALCSAGGQTPKAEELDSLRAAIGEDPAQAVLDHLRPRLTTDANFLLLVDQFEEIFAFRGAERDEPELETVRAERLERERRRREAAEFVDLLLSLAEQKELPVYVVLTMRSDFIGDCDLFYGLPEALNRSRYLVPRLKRSQLREAIEGPALLQGQRLAPRLVDVVLNDLGDRSDRLPILQHALMRSWSVWQYRGDSGPIDFEHFNEAGTLRDALPLHANEAVRQDDLEITAMIFKCLTETDPNHRKVRRAASVGELVEVTGAPRETVEAILCRFNEDGRNFLRLSSGTTSGETRVEICHESLIRQWDLLTSWVDDERGSRDQFRELVHHARHGRALLRDPDLQLALDWRERTRPTAAWAKRYSRDRGDFNAALTYLEQSRIDRDKATRRRRRNRNVAVLASLGVGLSLAALTLWAFDNAAGERDAACIALAWQWMEKDPTRAALLLLEAKQPERTAYAAATMQQVLAHPIASDVLAGHEGPVSVVAFSPDGRQVVTGSLDRTARIWSADGSSPSVLLSGHEGPVLSAAFSPDGKRVVTSSEDGTARVWRADGSGEPLVLRGHEGPLRAAEVSPDGTQIVTASDDGTARIWRATGVGQPVVLSGHEGPLLAASFSPDGTQILTGSQDGTGRLWRTDGSGEPVVLRGQEGSVVVAKFSPDGSRMLTAGADGTARVWRSDGSGEPVVLGRKRNLASVEAASFSPDGREIAIAYGDLSNLQTVEVWNADGAGTPTLLVHENDIRGLAFVLALSFSPDGKHVATASRDGSARVWLHDASSPPLVLRGHTDYVGSVAFSPDGARVVTGSVDGTARIWKLEQATGTRVLDGHKNWVRTAAFSRDGRRVVTASDDGTARVWPVDGSGAAVVLQGHEGPVRTAAFSPDGRRVVTCSEDGTTRVWPAEGSGVPVVLRGHEGPVRTAAFSSEGARVLTASEDGTARVWRADGSGEPVVLRGHDGSVEAAAFSPDGRRVVTASADRTARVWQADGAGEAVVLSGHEGAVQMAAFSPDGERIVTASADWTARIWRADGSALSAPLQHDGWVGTAAFSPDGTRIVTASDDGLARVWSADGSGSPVVLSGSTSQLLTASFSPDGAWVLASARDGSVRIWRTDGSGESRVLRGHEGAVSAASFSPDGMRIVTASEDGTARIWNHTAEALQRVLASVTHACLDAHFRETYLRESPGQSRRRFQQCERRHGRSS